MNDKDTPNIFNGTSKIMLFHANSDHATASELGSVVADSLTILAEDDLDDTNFAPKPLSFKFTCDKTQAKTLAEMFYIKQFNHAQKLLDELQSEVKSFYTTNPPRNRKERRERAKMLKRKIDHFNSYCERWGIKVNQK